MEKLITVDPSRFIVDDSDATLRDGVRLEKGAVLTPDFVMDNKDLIEHYLSYWSAYPDRFLDLITPKDSQFKLYFYQRIVLRALMRYKQVYVTACRAFSKSFISILAIMLQCIFMPGKRWCPFA